jgi:catechol 2,3-dioxygenase-like lactoylglutathione lyase family enzyme
MNRNLAHISILVNDYDEAIEFYTQKLDFELVENTKLTEKKRWVLVKPKGNGACSLLLAKADNETQRKFIGNQSGGRVFLFLTTDNLERDYESLIQRKVSIVREPSEEPYGKVLVFEDLYGNKWDLIQPSESRIF